MSEAETVGASRVPVRTFATWGAAAISVALVVGAGVWGWRLMEREAVGVPIIRAAEGPMRIAPEEPGGDRAEHQGLSVSRIAAGAGEIPLASEVRLAPRAVELTAEDMPAPDVAEPPAIDAMDLAVAEALGLDAATIFKASAPAGPRPLPRPDHARCIAGRGAGEGVRRGGPARRLPRGTDGGRGMARSPRPLPRSARRHRPSHRACGTRGPDVLATSRRRLLRPRRRTPRLRRANRGPGRMRSRGAEMSAPGATIFGCAGPDLSDDEAAFFADARPWGFILFDRNLREPDQIRALTRRLREVAGHDAPILIDQEGGRVARLRPPLARDWLPPREHAAGPGGEIAVHDRYSAIGRELRDYGIDVNCVPCADVARDFTHQFLANRCLGDDPERVASLARSVADGCVDGGVLPVLKHIPGHGAARADSHETAPVVDLSLDDLRRVDFAPFAALADLPLGMTAHVVYAAIDDTRVATLSPDAIGLIRQDIGFDGLLMTDDICMGALGGTPAENTRAAITAGCDVILHCNGDLSEMESVAAEAGALAGEALDRADRALAKRPEVASV